MSDFLLEIGCEELPAGYILPALEAFEASFKEALAAEELSCKAFEATATPRRLVFFAGGLPEKQADRVIEVSGPPARAAFDAEDKPTRAAEGFARSQGATLDSLVVKETARGKYVFAKTTLPARDTGEILAGLLPGLMKAIPFPKSMYWSDQSDRFARPLKRILALLDAEVVPFEVYGVVSGRLTDGHPFLAPGTRELASADLDALKTTLRDAFVLVDRGERRAKILSEIEEALAAHGGTLREEALLDEVTDLVEWPEVLEGSFSEEYLVLPEEVVATAMMSHQRYFPVRNSSGKLVNRFLTVANRTREYCDGIREGNERVLTARLYDAKFFWQADLKKPLEEFAGALGGVVYLAGLGTVADKVARLGELAAFAADSTGAARHKKAAVEAASLSKADLLTEMVGEFPSLQGVVGREYALAEGRDASVAAAIYEHYLPRTLSGELPQTAAGKLVALADKADTLAGAFVMGMVPSGSQDPYGLRRAAAGILRIIIESGMHLGLRGLLQKAWELAAAATSHEPRSTLETLIGFMRERLYQYYLDRGHRHDILRACLGAGFDNLSDFHSRVSTLSELSAEPLWGDLVTAVERTFNISKGYQGPPGIDPKLLAEEQERRLYDLLASEGPRMEELTGAGDYRGASLAFVETFAEPLHTFFEEVYVNVDDEKVRSNRLALIKAINRLYSSRIADLALVVGQ